MFMCIPGMLFSCSCSCCSRRCACFMFVHVHAVWRPCSCSFRFVCMLFMFICVLFSCSCSCSCWRFPCLLVLMLFMFRFLFGLMVFARRSGGARFCVSPPSGPPTPSTSNYIWHCCTGTTTTTTTTTTCTYYVYCLWRQSCPGGVLGVGLLQHHRLDSRLVGFGEAWEPCPCCSFAVACCTNT